MAGLGYPTWNGTGSVGTDLSLTIVNDQTGAAVTLDGPRLRFEADDNDHLLEGTPSDNGGKPWFRVIPKGQHGTIEVERMSADFEALKAFLDSQFYAGQPQSTFTITTTSTNTGGSNLGGTARFQYRGSVFHGYKSGAWERESLNKPSVQFAAVEKVAL